MKEISRDIVMSQVCIRAAKNTIGYIYASRRVERPLYHHISITVEPI